jgi:hypothetical protein
MQRGNASGDADHVIQGMAWSLDRSGYLDRGIIILSWSSGGPVCRCGQSLIEVR